MKICTICTQEKPLDQFAKHSQKADGRSPYCKLCDNERKRKWREANKDRHDEWRKEYVKGWRAENPEKVASHRRVQTLKQYGLTSKQYDEMLDTQGGCCAICAADKPGGRSPRFHVDHCHDTGKVRGLLCTNCNMGLGKFGEDIDRMKIAIAYLEAHR